MEIFSSITIMHTAPTILHIFLCGEGSVEGVSEPHGSESEDANGNDFTSMQECSIG